MKKQTIRNTNRSRGSRAGFSFLEIMLVVVIIGILAGLVGPRLVGQNKKARVNASIAQLESLKSALTLYNMASGTFPSTSQGIKALVVRPSDFPENDWPEGGFLKDGKIPRDAWGSEFEYAYPGEKGLDYDLSSPGPDRQMGTSDDINGWEGSEKDKL